MRIFIFEYIAGGGMAGQPISPTLEPLGRGMLEAATADFIAAGHRVTTLLDERVSAHLGKAQVHTIDGDADEPALAGAFDAAAAAADAALVIAPESGRLLERWSARLEALGVRSLGSAVGAITLCSDKLTQAHRLAAAGVRVPETHLYKDAPAADGDRIVKPRFGAGCEQTYRWPAGSPRPAVDDADAFISQPLIPGRPASAAFIVHSQTIRPLLAGWQLIETRDNTLAYRGGRLPLEPALMRRALDAALPAVRAVPGLRGYVGVDLVLGDAPGGDTVIELNPRLSVAYIGLRQLAKTNLARAILDPAAAVAWKPTDQTIDYPLAPTSAEAAA